MNLFTNLWNGQEGLAKTYWMWGVVAFIPWGLALSAVTPGSTLAVLLFLAFVVYYVISLTGEKFVRELIWSPAMGMWVSSFILLPLGVFLSYKATRDSVIMNADFYVEAAKKVLGITRIAKYFTKKTPKTNRTP